MFVSALGAVIKGDVFGGLIELQARGRGETLNQRRLSGELVRQLVRFQHGLRVDAGSSGQAGVKREGGRGGSLTRLIGTLQEFLFDLEFVFRVGNVGRSSRSDPQGSWVRDLPGRGCQQKSRMLQDQNSCAEHENQQSAGLTHHSCLRDPGRSCPSSPFRLRFVQA